jgi:outer membrane protein OmpA-like peptidoglycan-associated protein
MPPSSVAARSLALAVIGVGAASFAAHGQNVTAFNPYSGAGLAGGPLPQYAPPPTAPAADATIPGPVVGPAFNPWSSRSSAEASRQTAPPQQTAAAPAQAGAGASLPPPPPGPIRSRVVAVPELPTGRGPSRDVQKAATARLKPAVKPAAAPAVAPQVPVDPSAAPRVVTPQPSPAPPVAATSPPRSGAAPQRQMAALAPVPSPPASAPARNVVATTVTFAARSTELSDASKTELDRLARDITDRTLRQVELRTIADTGEPDSRKISLARALIIRNYLIDKGVRSRIEIASIVGNGGERVEILLPGT